MRMANSCVIYISEGMPGTGLLMAMTFGVVFSVCSCGIFTTVGGLFKLLESSKFCLICQLGDIGYCVFRLWLNVYRSFEFIGCCEVLILIYLAE